MNNALNPKPHSAEQTNDIKKNLFRASVTLFMFVLLVIHFSGCPHRLDSIALGLIGLGILPWLSSLIESAKLPGGWEFKFRHVELEQYRQRQDFERITQFLLENFLTGHELTHLQKLANNEPFPFNKSQSFETELRRLIALNLIDRKPNRGIRSLFHDNDDVRKHLKITNRGIEYLNHRGLLPHRNAGEQRHTDNQY